jgi:hypothetical protein
MANQIKNVTIVGTGVIGASWAALYLARGTGAKRGSKRGRYETQFRRSWKDTVFSRTKSMPSSVFLYS